MNEDKLQTPFGVFSGVTLIEYYPDGAVKGIRLNEKNAVITHAGELIPYYGEDSPRRKYKSSVTFHQNGMLRSVSLEEQQEVDTPIGELPAELVTFYDTGELKRVFPLDGKISGFWSEEEERALNIPLSFDLDFTSFTAMISGICFYKSGDIRSVTLFPDERVTIKHSAFGTAEVRQGFSLYESGALESLEPAEPIKVVTPIGTLTAYDLNPNGVNADCNSLYLDEQGRITSLVNSGEKLFITTKKGTSYTLTTKEIFSDVDDSAGMHIPLKLDFDYEEQSAAITDYLGTPIQCAFDDTFIIYPDNTQGCSSSDCASCSLCKK
jgi:hypothetical protein